MTPDGPRVVALGGGHGLAATLQAARRYASELTAVVSVADDGGSSGRLRQAFGIPAPGDLRRCLVAMAEDPSATWAAAFEHRFGAGDLEGHALGNVVIAGLADALGDFGAALDEAGRMVGAVGRVLPATTGPVVLHAEASGVEIKGQVAVASAGRISCVSLDPPDPDVPADVLDAITSADQVVLGPGSLFTSVLAVAAVPAIRDAVAKAGEAGARRVYVCNLRPQVPETAGYDVAAHVDALLAHGVEADVVLHDPATMATGDVELPVVGRALAADDGWEHDPGRLAAALSDLIG